MKKPKKPMTKKQATKRPNEIDHAKNETKTAKAQVRRRITGVGASMGESPRDAAHDRGGRIDS